ncbi:hypothetical protein GCM10022245_73110 [Streptomyces mayteni]
MESRAESAGLSRNACAMRRSEGRSDGSAARIRTNTVLESGRSVASSPTLVPSCPAPFGARRPTLAVRAQLARLYGEHIYTSDFLKVSF